MLDHLVDPFAETPKERLFRATAQLESATRYIGQNYEPDPFDIAMARRQREHEYNVRSRGVIEKFLNWLVSMWINIFNRPPTLEDNLADMVIVMLEQKPESWKFSGDRAEFEEMHVKLQFPSWKRTKFNIRTMDHKTYYPDVTPTRSKRKELYLKVLAARDMKILASVTADVKKQVFLITDQSKGAEA